MRTSAAKKKRCSRPTSTRSVWQTPKRPSVHHSGVIARLDAAIQESGHSKSTKGHWLLASRFRGNDSKRTTGLAGVFGELRARGHLSVHRHVGVQAPDGAAREGLGRREARIAGALAQGKRIRLVRFLEQIVEIG